MKLVSALNAALALSLVSPTLSENYGFAGEIYDNKADFEEFDHMTTGDRVMLVTKKAWPECQSDSRLKGDAYKCKRHIDAQLKAMQLEVPIDSIIIWTRHDRSPTNNAMVIPIDENNMCIGRSGGGIISYDFDWCVPDGPSILTNPRKIALSRKLLKPSKWSTHVAGIKDLDCDYYGDHPDLEDWHQNAHDYMGGDFENACSTADGITKYEAAKTAGSVVVPGCQQIPPIDCGGMSGVDACNMVKKHMVPYANADGKNMECWLSYGKGTNMDRQIESDLNKNNVERDSTVKIFAIWETRRVTAVPRMTGPRAKLGSD
mmetsp:Transcript_31200/g.63433  ORF Transcript_31200/g.63433 Transcript_31200/m.63433 type:complete len:317 (-) Transcript_31200:151-1101(-)|eukprot:CAMPEP_0171437824 /NCGR_PEP_ID=MMETSP0881-20121228/17011_1 /TAXON_ID=67004 /ORGANISM="Thalassiosira weissflogii, Strain CCMP1336" /LENGTH=316 /DNA_ID=CAMNT_0011959555 /DNA_START=89 /DNA_END=1039 /DNA_ORIENTATION=+